MRPSEIPRALAVSALLWALALPVRAQSPATGEEPARGAARPLGCAAASVPLFTRVRLRTSSDPAHALVGSIQSCEGDVALLRTDQGPVMRVPTDAIVAVDLRKPGSPAMATLGAAAGALAGFGAGIVLCVSVECDSSAALWIPMVLGGVLGGAGAGAGQWVPLPLAPPGRLTMGVQPRPRGGVVGLRVSF